MWIWSSPNPCLILKGGYLWNYGVVTNAIRHINKGKKKGLMGVFLCFYVQHVKYNEKYYKQQQKTKTTVLGQAERTQTANACEEFDS